MADIVEAARRRVEVRVTDLVCPGYSVNIEKAVTKNEDYRRVLHSTSTMRLVVMRLRPGEHIGAEVHPETTQFVRVEEGHGFIRVNDSTQPVAAGDAVMVAPGAEHDVWAGDKSELAIYVLYSPPTEHEARTVQRVKPNDEGVH